MDMYDHGESNTATIKDELVSLKPWMERRRLILSQNNQYSVPLSNISPNLQADCETCFALCCVGLYFSCSEGFPNDKEAGQPCHNLQPDFRCCVHKNLRQLGLNGCTSFDCFGAGQKVSQVSFGGQDWRNNPEFAKKMFDVFQIMRQLHELLWYLTEAVTLQQAHLIHASLCSMYDKTDHITRLSPDMLMELDMAEHRAEVNTLLKKTSEYVRTAARGGEKIPARRFKTLGGKLDLMGADLKRTNLIGENLRGAFLIAADLKGVDCRGADFIGADLRDADLRGADLTNSIFLTQAQINAAIGDTSTKLPLSLTRPTYWGN